MSDFIIQIGHQVDPQYIAHKLQDRPGLEDHPVCIWPFEWGSLVIQPPTGSGYKPFERDGYLYACVGRPRIMGCEHETDGPSGFARELADRWRFGDENELFESMTGTHALLCCSSNEISILTDRMGALPIYQAEDSNGRVVSYGTLVDYMARIVHREQNWDLVSLAEMLVFNNITFPFSTRVGIEEIAPASITNIKTNRPNPLVEKKVLWAPKEPDSWFADDEMIDLTERALRSAAIEATRGAKSVAVTLSGGLDSRAVLAALPKKLSVSAITYVTHENNETHIAQKVARAAGVEHLFARRDEDYFAELLIDRGIRLLGSERRAAAHGFCIRDNGLHRQFDVILGGQLSDTFMKHHYMPYEQRELIRPKNIKERTRQIFGMQLIQSGPSALSTIGRHLALIHLKHTMREAVVARREERLKKVKEIRPATGEEWSRFWPTSRQDDLAHVLGNIRLFPFDTLFMQRTIIDIAVALSPEQRYAGRITNQAFTKLYGLLGDIENANTGIAASGGEFVSRRQRRRHSKNLAVDISGATPWSNVQTSWADNITLQRSHPMWIKSRSKLCNSPAVDLLDQLTEQPAETLVRNYSDQLPPTFNQMLIQIGLCIDGSLSKERESKF